MSTKWVDTWKGGRVYEDRDGARRYVIERMRHGKRYTCVLPAGVTDPEGELALFKRDPEGYVRRSAETGLLPEEAVILTKEEAIRFKSYLENEKHRVPAYVNSVMSYLTDWANALNGRDLRNVTVDDLYKLLDGWPAGRNYRIASIRTFCTWLQKRQRLAPHENASRGLEAIKPPPARRLKLRGYTIQQVEEYYRALPTQIMRDYYLLGAKCGMHGTEIARIAKGEVQIDEVHQNGIAAVLRFIHKSRYDHRQSVDAQCLAAVRRLIALGRVPTAPTCLKWRTRLKLNVMHKYLRHSFFTWGRKTGRVVRVADGGLTLSEMAAAVGHRSMLMGKDHYDNDEVPAMVIVPIKLEHPEDPAVLLPIVALRA